MQTGQEETGWGNGMSAAMLARDGIPSAIDLGPWHLYANCCQEQVCRAFLSRAGQIWVVPRRCSWDVQWIQSAQINGALFGHFFLATEPADNSGGRAGGPWAAVDKACGGRHSGSGGLPSYTPRPRLQTNLASVSFFCLFSQWRTVPVNYRVKGENYQSTWRTEKIRYGHWGDNKKQYIHAIR